MIEQIHAELEKMGMPIVGVAEEGGKFRIDFDRSATEQQRQQARTFVDAFTEKTDEEILQEIRTNKDALIEQLLRERFYGHTLDRRIRGGGGA